MSGVIGQRAEQQACEYLAAHGLTLVQKNFRCKAGEIDLIMRDGDDWVFVEVKYRSDPSHGQAVEYFHAAKRKKCELAIQHFMLKQRLNPAMVPHRIDVIAIDGNELKWLKSI